MRTDQPQPEVERENSQGHEQAPEKLSQPQGSRIRHTVAVMSGKGGVGKSSIAALLASILASDGHRVGVLDADITGPSIPKLLGVNKKPGFSPLGMVPPESTGGIKVMSLNLLLANEDDPVIWRGPLIGSAIKQFWTEVAWGEVDYLVIDLPPGTGDAPLTVLQSLPVDGLIIVSSPQELAVMVVRKAIRMARMLKVRVIGLVENMSGIRCPRCGESFEVFGPSQAANMARSMGLRLLGVLPLDPEMARLGDRGEMDQYRAADFLSVIPSILADAPAGDRRATGE